MDHPKIDPEKWLLEEYKLLSSHYFHEDNFYLKTHSVYAALDAALLAFIQTDFFVSEANIVGWTIPVIGLVSTLAWFGSLVRVRELRRRVEARILEIEKGLNLTSSGLETDKDPLNILGIRFNQPASRFFSRIPATIWMFSIPSTFFVIWFWILLFYA